MPDEEPILTSELVDEITDAVIANSLAPRKASNGRESAEMNSIADLIAADKYLKTKTAVSQFHFGVRRIKMEPPGSV